MLKAFEIARIKALAAQGYSQREIARLTRHGRKRISKLLAGHKRQTAIATIKPRKLRHPRRSGVSLSIDYVRCKGCGRLVQQPCLACQIERLQTLDQFLKAA
jgi:hypothetical protein